MTYTPLHWTVLPNGERLFIDGLEILWTATRTDGRRYARSQDGRRWFASGQYWIPA